MTEYTLTDASVGDVLSITDGLLVSLSMTQSGGFDGSPRFDEGKLIWVSGYFVLRGSLDIRDLICLSPQSGGGGGPDGVMVANHGLGYRGDLLVVAVPRGSTWSLTISDVESPRAPPPTPGWAPNGAFGDYPSYGHHGSGRRSIRQPEPELVEPMICRRGARSSALSPRLAGRSRRADCS